MTIVNTIRLDKDVTRIEANDHIVGFVIRMSDGSWMQFGPEMAAPISKRRFASPKAASKAFPLTTN